MYLVLWFSAMEYHLCISYYIFIVVKSWNIFCWYNISMHIGMYITSSL